MHAVKFDALESGGVLTSPFSVRWHHVVGKRFQAGF
jgi:hypothetical protein